MARLSRRKKPGRREYLRASLERRGTSFFMGEPFPPVQELLIKNLVGCKAGALVCCAS
jgi:hypothetical protein